jgi:hypothetical protein
MDEIRAWRRARRSARATQLLPDGTIVVDASEPSPWAVTLEDASGAATRDHVRASS